MVNIDVSGYDGVKLAVWTIADVSAILWGLSAADVFDIQSALGANSDMVLLLVGLIGVYSIVTTWTDIGNEVR